MIFGGMNQKKGTGFEIFGFCFYNRIQYSVTEAYFSLCRQYAHFFMLLKRNNLLFLVLQKFDEYLPAINDLFLSNPVYRGKSKQELIYQAGGFWNITIHWINDGMEESPEEMAEVISSIMPSPFK